MIIEERLKELIKEEATIFKQTPITRKLYPIKLNKNYTIKNDKVFYGCELIGILNSFFETNY